MEALDHRLIENQTQLGKHVSDIEELPRRDHPHAAWLMVQFGADTADESETTAHRFRDWLVEEKGYAAERIKVMYAQQEGGHSGDLWEVREGGLGATAFPPDGDDHWPGWEDSAVPPESVGDYLRQTCRRCMTSTAITGRSTATSGRAASIRGSISTCEPPRGSRTYRAFMEEAADLCMSYGGSLSGEHGDGQTACRVSGETVRP